MSKLIADKTTKKNNNEFIIIFYFKDTGLEFKEIIKENLTNFINSNIFRISSL